MRGGIPSWLVFEVELLTVYGHGCSTWFHTGQNLHSVLAKSCKKSTQNVALNSYLHPSWFL